MGDGRWKQMSFFLGYPRSTRGWWDDRISWQVLVWNHPILSVLFTMATLRSSDFVVRRFNFREGFLKMGDLKWCKFGWFGVPPTLGNFHIYIIYNRIYIYIFFLGVKPTFDSTRFSNHSITPSRWMLKHAHSPNGMVYVRNICISMDQDLWLGFKNWSVCNIWNTERQVHWFYLHMKSHLWWISYLQWLNSAD